jgi:hypothetical protein
MHVSTAFAEVSYLIRSVQRKAYMAGNFGGGLLPVDSPQVNGGRVEIPVAMWTAKQKVRGHVLQCFKVDPIRNE